MTEPKLSPGPLPVLRPASRLVVLNDHSEILLFHVVASDLAEPSIWITPGGGLEEDETAEQAAQRELWEETGLHTPIGPCIWLRSHVWRWGDRWIDSRERFYLVRSDTSEVAPALLEDVEAEVFAGLEWWSVEKIRNSPEVFAPRRLAELLSSLLAGDIPCEPVEVGV